MNVFFPGTAVIKKGGWLWGHLPASLSMSDFLIPYWLHTRCIHGVLFFEAPIRDRRPTYSINLYLAFPTNQLWHSQRKTPLLRDCSMMSFEGKMISITKHPHRSPWDSTNSTPKLTLQLELKSSVKLGGKSPRDERPTILSLCPHTAIAYSSYCTRVQQLVCPLTRGTQSTSP